MKQDDGVALASAGPYANHFHLASEITTPGRMFLCDENKTLWCAVAMILFMVVRSLHAKKLYHYIFEHCGADWGLHVEPDLTVDVGVQLCYSVPALKRHLKNYWFTLNYSSCVPHCHLWTP